MDIFYVRNDEKGPTRPCHSGQICLFMHNRTSLIISHRLSTIKKADKIIVLDKGKITDSGNHKELLEKSKYYQNWVTKQQIN